MPKHVKVKKALTAYQKTIKELSDRIVVAQQAIRLLDTIKWDAEIQSEFFKHKFKNLPPITPEYYQKNALPFDPVKKIDEFYGIEIDIRRLLGQFNPVAHLMLRMCREYRLLIRMIKCRGLPEFWELSQELYGGSEDAFFAGDPNLTDLANMISSTLDNIKDMTVSDLDEKRYSSEQVVSILRKRMDKYFKGIEVHVILSDGIVADAAAGSDTIRVRSGAFFSKRDIRILEVHEGWVHIGTTINGSSQPICTFLSKGPPSSTITQEGLAIMMEILAFASYPERVRHLTNRIRAIRLAEKGANFIEVFNFFREQGLSDERSYGNTVRIFRGSVPDGGPFTKDLCYSKGLVLIYNYMRLAVLEGRADRIPLLFAGKTSLGDLRTIADLVEQGLVVPPQYVPSQMADLSAVAAWLCYANFISHLNIDKIARDYKNIL